MTSCIFILSIINNKSHTTLTLLPYCTRSAKRNITFQSTKMPEVLKCPKCDANADVTKDGKIARPLHHQYSCINVCSGKWAHCASCKSLLSLPELIKSVERERLKRKKAKMRYRQQHLPAQRKPWYEGGREGRIEVKLMEATIDMSLKSRILSHEMLAPRTGKIDNLFLVSLHQRRI